MPSLRLPPTPLRRLLSAVLALSVLLTTLGWEHRPCDESATRYDVASATSMHAGMHDEAQPAREGSHAPSRDCPDHDRHEGRGADGCALAAHCAVGAVASTPLVPVARRLLRAPTIELTMSRPLDASHQPDSPPPKA